MSLFVVQVGRHLYQHQTEIAQAILACVQQNSAPPTAGADSAFDLDEESAPTGCIERVMSLVESLAQSITVAEPLLFGDYIEWFRDISSHREPVRHCADLRAGI